MWRVVVDTNIWVRALLGGKVSLPVLEALRMRRFQLVVSDALIEELREVVQRPRLQRHIATEDVEELLRLMAWYGEVVELRTIPPRCRDPKDHPVLATAIDGRAQAIFTGDGDLRDDDELRAAVTAMGIALWGVRSFVEAIEHGSATG